MDYSALSDQEINLAVAKALGRTMEPTLREHSQAVYESHGGGWGSMHDFCNTSSDAWPIIADNEINILWNWNEEGLHGATALPLYEYEHENALRAAMIVFLMIQGSSNVQDNPARNLLR